MSIAFISALQETTLNILGCALAGWVVVIRIEARPELVKIARNMSSKFDSSFIPIYGYMVSGVSPAAGKKTAGLIEKETLKKRISNIES